MPALYLFTKRAFDAIAWISPWLMALNYTALVAVGAWLLMTRKHSGGS